MKDISAVVLTFNSADRLAQTLAAASTVADDVFVVDSYSTDRTLDIAREAGAHVVQHEFIDYAAQRNWAIDRLPIRTTWQLHLDADEALSPELCAEIIELPDDARSVDGYAIPRLVVFSGREIRHGGMWPLYHLRLFRSGRARCEDRRYDQHFYLTAEGAEVWPLRNPMVDHITGSLGIWTAQHVRWAELQAADEATNRASLQPLSGRMRWVRRGKSIYLRMPVVVRPWLLFFYRYVIRRGFLDGREGLVFFTLQTLWFRMLVDGFLLEKGCSTSSYEAESPQQSAR